MKKVSLRNFIVICISFILNQAIVLTMNPFGIGYFVAAYRQKSGRVLLILLSIFSMFLKMPLNIVFKYIGVILAVMIITKIAEHKQKTMKTVTIGIVAGLLMMSISLGYNMGMNPLWRLDIERIVLMAVLEGVIVFASVQVFERGIDAILFYKNDDVLGNEAQISLAIMMALAFLGVESSILSQYSVIESAMFFLILYMGYRYGSGAGAITGTAIGCVLAYQQQDATMLAFLCVIGVLAGAFREKGRLASGILYLVITLLIGYFAWPYVLMISVMRGLLVGCLLFLLLPNVLAKRSDFLDFEKKQEAYQVADLKTKERLKEFSSSFKKLSMTFNETVKPRVELSKEEVEDVFDELTNNVCSQCSRCEYCWEKEYRETFDATSDILAYCSKYGDMTRQQLPLSFRRRCINLEGFLSETSRVVEVAKLNLNWRNRLLESRLAVAGQLQEVASVIDEFTEGLGEGNVRLDSDVEKLKKRISVSKVKVKSLTIIEKTNGRQMVLMTAKTKRGCCVTSKELCEMIKEVLGKRFVLAKGCRMVVAKEYNTYEFLEDIHFKTIQGVAKTIKAKEKVSGDSFSFIPLDSGQFVMSLSDGMGTGESAHEDSEYIIEVLEQLIESGFGKHSAVRLINSLMFLRSDKQAFSTVDMGILDLYSGSCEFVKIGASTTFIKRGHDVEDIHSTTLPMGAFTQVEYEGVSREMQDGDMIIMVTDGIINSMEGDQKEERLKTYIAELDVVNPQEMANRLLEFSMSSSHYKISDDMTILTCGVYRTGL